MTSSRSICRNCVHHCSSLPTFWKIWRLESLGLSKLVQHYSSTTVAVCNLTEMQEHWIPVVKQEKAEHKLLLYQGSLPCIHLHGCILCLDEHLFKTHPLLSYPSGSRLILSLQLLLCQAQLMSVSMPTPSPKPMLICHQTWTVYLDFIHFWSL